MTGHLTVSTVIGHVRDVLNDPAAGVRTLCPCTSLHGFGLQVMLMTLFGPFPLRIKVVSIQMQDSKKSSNEHDNRDPPPPTFRLLYT